MPNCHTAILKQEFGIGPRDKQKLNFGWETERYMGTGVLPMTDDWIDTSRGHGLGREKEGKAAMGGCTEPCYENSILHATCFSCGGMMDEVKMLCWCQTWIHTDEMKTILVKMANVVDVVEWFYFFALEPPTYILPFMQCHNPVKVTQNALAVLVMLPLPSMAQCT